MESIPFESNIDCNHPINDEIMYIINGFCWKCNEPIKVAVIRGSFYKRHASHSGPETFDQSEIKLAEANGVLLKEQFSNTMNETYLANTCTKCDTFIGQFYLFSEYYHLAEYGTLKFDKSFIVGQYCEICDEKKILLNL